MPKLTESQRHVQAVRDRRFTPLRRALKVPVWVDLGLRLGAATALVMIVVLIHWFDREGLVDNADGHISFLDVVYFTMISMILNTYRMSPPENEPLPFPEK